MIRLVKDTIDRNDINSLIEWLSKDEIPRLTKGELTLELENKWANKIGTQYSVFVNSGSSAIFLTLVALKYGGYLKNNKIVVPSLSWATDLSSPMILDYESILCDCNLEDLSCDLNHLEDIFKTHSPSVLILVSPLGLVPKMKEVLELCDKYEVILLEDVCESMGSKYENQYLGSFGLASFYSTYFGHHLSTIEGGFINTNDEKLYELLIMIRSHGWDRDLSKLSQSNLRIKYKIKDFDSLYTFYVPGMNLRSTDLQAFIGLKAIDKLDRYAEARNHNFKIYSKQIETNLLNLVERPGDFVSNFAYPVMHEKRDLVVKELIKNNIEVRPVIAGNMDFQPMWLNYGNPDNSKNLTNAIAIHNQGFYVPNHQELSPEDISTVSSIINKI